MTSNGETLLLSRSDVASLLDLRECIRIVENGFRLLGEGKIPPPGILGVHGIDGGLHVKAGYLSIGRSYFVAKANTNFPSNPKRFQLPAIQGVIVLCDGENGMPLALMDSIEITIQRTGAATAVAAKHLARASSRVLTVIGCGNQGYVQLKALLQVFPLQSVFAFDIDSSVADRFVERVSAKFHIKAEATVDFPEVLQQSDICVTCTPARNYFLRSRDVRAGTFIAAVGADNEHKQELDPALFASSKIVVDNLVQCSSIGDLHHALEAGSITPENVHAELADVVAGKKEGRTGEDEITVFDSTGIAIEDAVSAAYVYERAIQTGQGSKFRFAA